MKKYLKPFLIVGTFLLVVVLVSWLAFPSWSSTPGGFWSLLGTAGLAVIGIIKDLVSINKDLKSPKINAKKPTSGMTQIMNESAGSEQLQKKSGGPQYQEMDKSPNSKQRQE